MLDMLNYMVYDPWMQYMWIMHDCDIMYMLMNTLRGGVYDDNVVVVSLKGQLYAHTHHV